MRPLLDYTSAAYHDLLDFGVIDAQGNSLGFIDGMWSDQHTGHFEFVGIKTGWFGGKNHLVPAADVQVDEAENRVQIPYDAAFIKGAPSFDSGAEIKEKHEAEIRRYYAAARGSAPVSAANAAEPTRTSVKQEDRQKE